MYKSKVIVLIFITDWNQCRQDGAGKIVLSTYVSESQKRKGGVGGDG